MLNFLCFTFITVATAVPVHSGRDERCCSRRDAFEGC